MNCIVYRRIGRPNVRFSCLKRVVLRYSFCLFLDYFDTEIAVVLCLALPNRDRLYDLKNLAVFPEQLLLVLNINRDLFAGVRKMIATCQS